MQMHPSNDASSEEINLIEIWLRKDIVRWIAGVLAGAIASGVALVVAAILSVISGREIWFPAKLVSSIVLGGNATEFGLGGFGIVAIVVGVVIVEAVGAFLGAVFAHFTATNERKPLMAMGLVWALFSWVFIWCLYSQSFKPVLWSDIPKSAALLVMLVFGLSLSSVSTVDAIVRGRKMH